MDIIDKLNIGGTVYLVGETIDPTTVMHVANTLTVPPTTSTKKDGDRTYVPGDIVRVVDAESDTGYTFYRLHAITNSGSAIWSKMDVGEVNIPEIVTVHITSNQSNTNDLINNVVVTASYLNQTFTQTYTGSDITFEIPTDTAYTITYSSVSGYSKPSTYSRTSVYGGRPTVTANYATEIVSYTAKMLNGTDVSNPVITLVVDGSTISNPTFPYKVPKGKSYTISAGVITGYRLSQSSYTRTASAASYTANFIYLDVTNGVYIYTTNGALVDPDDWNTSNNSTAIGVAVISDECAFVIDKGNLTNDIALITTNYSSTPNITTKSSKTEAMTDYDGQGNTEELSANQTEGAVYYCKSKSYTVNGNTINGHLGSAGEWQIAGDNKANIVSAMSKIGGTTIYNPSGSTITNYYHTSTLYVKNKTYSSNKNYRCKWYTPTIAAGLAANINGYCRPFYKLY